MQLAARLQRRMSLRHLLRQQAAAAPSLKKIEKAGIRFSTDFDARGSASNPVCRFIFECLWHQIFYIVLAVLSCFSIFAFGNDSQAAMIEENEDIGPIVMIISCTEDLVVPGMFVLFGSVYSKMIS